MEGYIVKVTSEPIKHNWIHTYKFVEDDFRTDEDDFVNFITFTSSLPKIFVVMRFYENGIESYETFDNIIDATINFYEQMKDQDLLYENEFHVIERNKNEELTSTIYSKNDDGSYYFPDKSTRYILKIFNLLDD
jgi:hypothetical protein